MAGRRKRVGAKDVVPEAEGEEPVVAKGRPRAPAKAARGKKTEEPVEVKEEEMEVKEEPEEREEDSESNEEILQPKEDPEPVEEVVKEEIEEEFEPEKEEEEEKQETPPPVKRGRKPAAAKPKQEVLEDEEEEESPPQKKGRKRAAGRPKQVVEDEEEEEDSPPQVKKGRKKAAAKPKKKVEDEEEDTPPQKRGRKRTVKPKQEVHDDDEEEEEECLPSQVKKGRNKAAPKAKLQAVIEEDDELPPIVKKNRGRKPAAKPKKEEEEEEEDSTPPVKKGKKRGPAPKPKIAPNATFVVQNVETEEDDEPSPPAAPKSKKKAASTAKAKPKAAKKKEPVGKAKEKENTDTSNLPKKSAVKTGVERVLVMKGRAAVDAVCPIAQDSHVYEEEDEIWDCMLNQTNIQFNNNKFYLIQLLEDDSSKSYSVWMRWGRVGANGQVKLFPCGSDLLKAKEIFMKKFSDKTRNEWEMRFMFEKIPGKYDLVKIDYSKGKDTPDSAAIMKKAKERANIECQLHPRVKAVIELICDVKCMEEAVVEMKYDAGKAPLGKLTTEQIKAGYLALKRIDDMVEGGKFVMKDLVQACNDFYTRVPHYFGMKVPPLIRSKEEIREKVALLEALGDIQAALSVLDQPIDVNTHPTDQHYRSLKCDMTPLEKESEEYKTIEKYMMTTHAKTHSQYKLELLEVLACRKESEYQRFKDVGNRMLLWHGSRMSNWAGILSQGLRIAPPEAPVTGYMFGKGIYFADMASKSANYCWANANKNVGFLLLSEVALGKSNELLQADYSANNLPQGCHSVKGCGRTAPRADNFTKLSDGTVVPLGPGVEVAPKNNINYSLLYNEYIVYDPAQVRTRFLLKVKFKY